MSLYFYLDRDTTLSSVVVVNTLCNSYKRIIYVLRTLSGRNFPFDQASDRDAMIEVFQDTNVNVPW
jgi:hypothetical protein